MFICILIRISLIIGYSYPKNLNLPKVIKFDNFFVELTVISRLTMKFCSSTLLRIEKNMQQCNQSQIIVQIRFQFVLCNNSNKIYNQIIIDKQNGYFKFIIITFLYKNLSFSKHKSHCLTVSVSKLRRHIIFNIKQIENVFKPFLIHY